MASSPASIAATPQRALIDVERTIVLAGFAPHPFVTVTSICKPHAMSGLLLDGGGTAAANAAGNEHSYRAVLAFLDEARAGSVPTLRIIRCPVLAEAA